jgi:hypothetical protein
VEFDELADALTFFDDQVQDLGPWADVISADGILDLQFSLNVVAPVAGNGFNFDPVFGNATAGGAVLLPPALWMFVSGLIGLASRYGGFRRSASRAG